MNQTGAPFILPDQLARHRLLLTGLVLAGLLVGAAVRHALAVRAGSEVILQVAPVDPRALLMGHFTHLDYAAERPVALSDLVDEPERSQIATLLADGRAHRLWLVLGANMRGYGEPVGLHLKRPKSLPAGRVAMRARTRRADYFLLRADEEATKGAVGEIEFDFGVDRYYADQAEALAIENAARTRTGPAGAWDPAVQAVVSVGADGVGRLAGVVVAGERRDLSWY
jgi:uncharacterized membrane-anchored protein